MEYAKLSTLKAGVWVRVDAGFACMRPHKQPVKYDDDGHYLYCDEGRHYLLGQLAEDGDSLIGIYPEHPQMADELNRPL